MNCDKADRLTSITHDLATDIVHSCTYDNASRATSFNTIGSGAATRGYGYDDAGQLTSKTGGTPESFAYDANGNRVTVGSQSIATRLSNRLTSDGNYDYAYDNEGNVTSRTEENYKQYLGPSQPAGRRHGIGASAASQRGHRRGGYHHVLPD